MKKIASLIIIVLFLVTCSKENSDENYCYSSSLMSQVNRGKVAVHGLTYNSNCLIYESTESFTYKRFSYDEQNLLVKVEKAYSFSPFSCVMIPGQSLESDPRKAEIAQYSLFEYDDAQRLIKKSTYFINSGNRQLTYYQTYEYGNNQVIKLSQFNPQGLLTQYQDFIYDNNGNITRSDLYINNTGIKLVQTLFYEFDNKNNPYRIFSCEGIPGVYTNKNNILSETLMTYNGAAESRSVNQNLYEYNDLNFPVRINELDCKYGK